MKPIKLKIRETCILGDPGAVSRVDKMFVVKVYCKIETSPWALTLTEPVPEAFELPTSDWPEKIFFWPIEHHVHHEHFIDPTNCPWVSEDERPGKWE